MFEAHKGLTNATSRSDWLSKLYWLACSDFILGVDSEIVSMVLCQVFLCVS